MTDVLRINRRDSLAQLVSRHPLNAHSPLLHFQRDTPNSDLYGSASISPVCGLSEPLGMPAVSTCHAHHRHIALEKAMALNVQPKSGSTELHRVCERCPFHVLDDVRQIGGLKYLACFLDQIVIAIAHTMALAAIGGKRLAGR